MQFALIKLDAAAGFDLERLAVLGSPEDVKRRLASLKTRSIKYSVPEAPVLEVGVEIPDDDAAALQAMARLCAEAGWTPFDRATGRFPDLRRSDPSRPAPPPPPMFIWWTTLPAWVRVLIGFAVAFGLFDLYMRVWIMSWE